MILKSDRIADLLESGDGSCDPLVITPAPDLAALRTSGSASVDLRLGAWFMSLRPTRMVGFASPEQGGSEVEKGVPTETHYVPFGRAFNLHPRHFVLGISLEWIRLPRKIAGYVIGKSSWGRRGLIIATAIGVHPGFTGCLTLELSNVGEVPIAITPGTLICQLFLHRVESELDHVDRTTFVGLRKPVLGSVGLDEMAKKLGEAHLS